jgi:Ribbon-helix-helix protein, copG family
MTPGAKSSSAPRAGVLFGDHEHLTRLQPVKVRLDHVDHAGNTKLDFPCYVMDPIRMTDKKQALSDVLNVRVDEPLAREVARIAERQGVAVSEVARQLIRHGVEVERQAEASLLKLPYAWDISKMRGRIVIEANWEPYTRAEVWDMENPDPDAWAEKMPWFEGDTP